MIGLAGLLPALVLPFLALGALQLFSPLGLSASTAAGWLAPGASAAVALVAAAGALLALLAGMRGGRLDLLILAAALAMLAASLGVEALAGPAISTQVPRPAVALGSAVAALLLAASSGTALFETIIHDRRLRIAVAIGLFTLIEVTLAALIFASDLPSVAVQPLRLAAGAAFVLSALGGLSRAGRTGSAWLGVGLLSMLVARTGTFDALIPLVALAAGSLSMAAASSPLRSAPSETLSAAPEPAIALPPPPLQLPSEHDETERLGRELRGTIEELMRARRTVELQRVEIERASTFDATTGVASRSAILDRLATEVAQARRYAHPLAVLLLDLDGFSELNANHGFVVGDSVLREVALRTRLRVREADALGRCAADAFLAILPHTDEAGTVAFADALRKRLAQRPIGTEAGTLEVTVSVGVALMRAGEELDADGLLARAEEALASARAGGGNRIAFDRLHGLARIDEQRAADASAEEETAQDSGA